MANAKKVTVKLNHNCSRPGCEGMPGDVIDVTPENAHWLIHHKGASAVNVKEPPAKVADEPAEKPADPPAEKPAEKPAPKTKRK